MMVSQKSEVGKSLAPDVSVHMILLGQEHISVIGRNKNRIKQETKMLVSK